MLTQETLREILISYASAKFTIDQATTEIKSLLKSKLPKEKNGAYWASRFSEEGVKIVKIYQNGFNSALTEIEKILEAL